jgi:hypothetical protein
LNVPAAPRGYFPFSKKFLDDSLSSYRHLKTETMNPPYNLPRRLYGGHQDNCQDRDDRKGKEPLDEREAGRSWVTPWHHRSLREESGYVEGTNKVPFARKVHPPPQKTRYWFDVTFMPGMTTGMS